MKVVQLSHGYLCVHADVLDVDELPVCMGDCVDCSRLVLGLGRRCDD
jgi:hypothetical protein